jgi:hypothetical protein
MHKSLTRPSPLPLFLQPQWRWVASFELGQEDCTAKEAELVAWLQQHGPCGPSSVELGLVCLRGGQVDGRATARLHAAVYSVLGDKMKALSIHVQRPELCTSVGCVPLCLWLSMRGRYWGILDTLLPPPAASASAPAYFECVCQIWLPIIRLVCTTEALPQLPCLVWLVHLLAPPNDAQGHKKTKACLHA